MYIAEQGTKTYWPYCNSTLAYTKVVSSVVDYHKNLTKANIRVLIFRCPMAFLQISSSRMPLDFESLNYFFTYSVKICHSVQWRSWYVNSAHRYSSLDKRSESDFRWELEGVVCGWPDSRVCPWNFSSNFFSIGKSRKKLDRFAGTSAMCHT